MTIVLSYAGALQADGAALNLVEPSPQEPDGSLLVPAVPKETGGEGHKARLLPWGTLLQDMLHLPAEEGKRL
ncbi:hypothetical protein A6R68_16898 [Neotoma lepida]|uniref:Uncharacterized protein n=1 Tax=Neotoma lepida TaxID=56216 RepID=A0A1A6HEH1_NEOLE|nr:hypothetical protein A6R68_16898 [Neotoma lepida]